MKNITNKFKKTSKLARGYQRNLAKYFLEALYNGHASDIENFYKEYTDFFNMLRENGLQSSKILNYHVTESYFLWQNNQAQKKRFLIWLSMKGAIKYAAAFLVVLTMGCVSTNYSPETSEDYILIKSKIENEMIQERTNYIDSLINAAEEKDIFNKKIKKGDWE